LIKLITECRDVAKHLSDIFQKITGISGKYDASNDRSSNALRNAVRAVKAVWNEKDIKTLLEVLDKYRNQFLLRMLLSLDTKVDKNLGQADEIKRNLSGVVEVLAIYQERQSSASTRHTQRLESRIEESDTQAKRFHEETIAAILTLSNGSTKVLKPSGQHVTAHVGLDGQSPHKIVRFGSKVLSEYADAEVGDLKLVEERILDCLYFRQMTDRLETVKPPHEATYEWIFCDPVAAEKPWDDFMQWLAEGSGCYWICGKAGSGKSTMMKFIYQDRRTIGALRQWAVNYQLTLAAFFFRGLGSGMQKSQEGLLRSLLYTVLANDRQFIPLVATELLPVATHLGPGEKLSEPSPAELIKWFRRFLELMQHRRYFFLIDGIDEFDGDPTQIVELITSFSGHQHVKFLLSSRPIPVCVENFAPFPKLQLHDLTRDDIRRYAEDCLGPKLRRKLEPADKMALVDQIVEKSFGVFIWVELSVRSVIRGVENRDNMAELQRRLDELPSDLADLYTHMLKGMSTMYRKQAAQLFRIAVTAMQLQTYFPLTTLQVAFTGEDATEVLGLPIRPLTKEEELAMSDEIDGRIRSRCCGLLETRRALPSERKLLSPLHFAFPCVDFLHRTVVEFLADPEVWKGIVERSELPAPTVPLFRSCLRMCKAFPSTKSIDVKTSIIWHMMRNAMTHARLSEELQNPIPAIYLRDLDKTMSQHWQVARKAGDDVYKLKVNGHWAASYHLVPPPSIETQQLSDALMPVDFLTLAIANTLSSFVSEELSSPDVSESLQKDGTISRHLFDATRLLLARPWDVGPSQAIRELNTLTICEQLLKHGADPNFYVQGGPGGETAWLLALQHAVKAKENRHLFRKGFDSNDFPRTFAKLVVSFIPAGADVNAQVLWRTKRYRDAELPIVFKRSAVSVLDSLFNPAWGRGGEDDDKSPLSSLLLDEAPSFNSSTLLANFHTNLMRLMADRGGVAREWRDDQLISGLPERPRSALAGPAHGGDEKSVADSAYTAGSNHRVRLRHKLGLLFKRDSSRDSRDSRD